MLESEHCNALRREKGRNNIRKTGQIERSAI